MIMDIWVVSTSNQLFTQGSLPETKFRKCKVVTGKISFFVIGAFCTSHSICLNIAFWEIRFVWTCCVFKLSTFNLSTFLKRVCLFHKICFKIKVLKMLKISSDCDIKTCQFLKRRAILKIPSTVFWKNLCSFCWLLNETSKKKGFSLLRQKPTRILLQTLLKWKTKQPFNSVYLMNHIFQTFVLFNLSP